MTARVYPGGVIQSRGYDNSSRVAAISSQLNNAGVLLTSQAYSFANGGDKANVQSWSMGCPVFLGRDYWICQAA